MLRNVYENGKTRSRPNKDICKVRGVRPGVSVLSRWEERTVLRTQPCLSLWSPISATIGLRKWTVRWVHYATWGVGKLSKKQPQSVALKICFEKMRVGSGRIERYKTYLVVSGDVEKTTRLAFPRLQNSQLLTSYFVRHFIGNGMPSILTFRMRFQMESLSVQCTLNCINTCIQARYDRDMYWNCTGADMVSKTKKDCNMICRWNNLNALDYWTTLCTLSIS